MVRPNKPREVYCGLDLGFLDFLGTEARPISGWVYSKATWCALPLCKATCIKIRYLQIWFHCHGLSTTQLISRRWVWTQSADNAVYEDQEALDGSVKAVCWQHHHLRYGATNTLLDRNYPITLLTNSPCGLFSSDVLCTSTLTTYCCRYNGIVHFKQLIIEFWRCGTFPTQWILLRFCEIVSEHFSPSLS